MEYPRTGLLKIESIKSNLPRFLNLMRRVIASRSRVR